MVHIDQGGRFRFATKNVGSQFEIEETLRLPAISNKDDWPVASTIIRLDDGVDITVAISRDGKGLPTSSQLVILQDTWPNSMKEPRVVREMLIPDPDVNGAWRFRYEQGLLSIYHGESLVGRAWVPGIHRNLLGFTLQPPAGYMECTSLSIRSNRRLATPLPETTELWNKIVSRNDKLLAQLAGHFEPTPPESFDDRLDRYLKGSNQADLPALTPEMTRLHDELLALVQRLPADPPDPDAASVFVNIASVERNARNYTAAREHLDAALKIRRAALNPWHPDIALALHNFGVLHREMHDLQPAREYLLSALAIRQNVLGTKHQDTAQSAEYLARVETELDRREDARLHLQQAIPTRLNGDREDKRKGIDDIMILARALEDDGLIDDASTQWNAAAAGSTRVFGPDHPFALMASTAVLTFRGEFKRNVEGLSADLTSLSQRALKLPIELSATSHYVLWTWQELAEDLALDGQFGAAAQFGAKARQLGDLLWPPGHPARTEVTSWAGDLALSCGDPSAISLLAEADASEMEFVDRSLSQLSDAEARQFTERTSVTRAKYLSALRLTVPPDARAAYRSVLRGTAPATRAALAKRLLRTSDPAVLDSAKQLDAQRTRLAAAVIEFRRKPDPDTAKRVADVLRDRESAERALAGQSEDYGKALSRVTSPLEELDRLLPANIAIVHIIPSLLISPTPGHPQILEMPGPKRSRVQFPYQLERVYEIFVLTRGEQGVDIKWFAVHKRDEIESALRSWSLDILGVQPDEPGDTRIPNPSDLLRKMLWLPIENELGAITQVVIVPPSSLGAMPWAAMPGPTPGSFLLDRFSFVTALNGQEAISTLSRQANRPSGGHLLLVGDLDYGPRAKLGDGQARTMFWPHLDHSKAELDAVAESWKGLAPDRLDHDTAIKSRVLERLGVAQFSVFSTHAFYESLPADFEDHDHMHGRLIAGHGDTLLRDWLGERVPSVECALVLSLANTASDPRASSASDSYLLGDELASLDLSQLSSVVLTACDSAIGRASRNEGTFGLQRAFCVAGARTVIATLWKVDDASAAAFARAYHRYLWENQLPALEAAHRAQQDVASEVRARMPKDSLVPEYYYWGPFSLLGDWR